MNLERSTQINKASPSNVFLPSGVFQRKCICGNNAAASGECAECAKKKRSLQRKLAIGASNDPLEHEADRVADQVLAMPTNSIIGSALPRIQRLTTQPTGQVDTAAASVDHVLASSGRPLEPALRQDMEQRFGHDFSQVRVHSSSAAEQSTRDVNAHAYTVGHNIVFGKGQFSPFTHDGQRLLAHELTHVVQQGGHGYSQGCISMESSDSRNERQASYLSKKILLNQNLREPISLLSNNFPILQKSDGEEELACTPPEELVCRDPAYDFEDWLRPRPGRVPVNPQIAGLPWERFVDNYTSVIYDLSYRDVGGNLSRWMRVIFRDGVEIDVSIYNDFTGETTTPLGVRDAVANGYLGNGGRVFPERMTPQTTPRLWAARRSALVAMADYNVRLIRVAMPAVTFIITMPLAAMGGGQQAIRRPTPRRLTRPRPGPSTPPPEPAPSPAPRIRPRGPGSQEASARAARDRAARRPPSSPLPTNQQVIRDTLTREHPGLHTNVATQAARGGSRAMGPGGAGADVVLINGGGREVSVHTGAFTSRGLGSHLQAEAMQANTTQVFLQVNSAGATRQGLLQMISGLRSAYPELRGVFVRIFGPDGRAWWSGIFRGP